MVETSKDWNIFFKAEIERMKDVLHFALYKVNRRNNFRSVRLSIEFLSAKFVEDIFRSMGYVQTNYNLNVYTV